MVKKYIRANSQINATALTAAAANPRTIKISIPANSLINATAVNPAPLSSAQRRPPQRPVHTTQAP